MTRKKSSTEIDADRERRANARALIDNLKRRPCMDCGREFPPICMDFDHRPDEEKTADMSSLVGASEDRILEEAAKCDVVCACCHRLRTQHRLLADREPEFGWPHNDIEFRDGRVVQVSFPWEDGW